MRNSFHPCRNPCAEEECAWNGGNSDHVTTKPAKADATNPGACSGTWWVEEIRVENLFLQIVCSSSYIYKHCGSYVICNQLYNGFALRGGRVGGPWAPVATRLLPDSPPVHAWAHQPTSLPATEWDLPRSPIDSLPVNANARGWRVEWYLHYMSHEAEIDSDLFTQDWYNITNATKSD